MLTFYEWFTKKSYPCMEMNRKQIFIKIKHTTDTRCVLLNRKLYLLQNINSLGRIVIYFFKYFVANIRNKILKSALRLTVLKYRDSSLLWIFLNVMKMAISLNGTPSTLLRHSINTRQSTADHEVGSDKIISGRQTWDSCKRTKPLLYYYIAGVCELRATERV